MSTDQLVEFIVGLAEKAPFLILPLALLGTLVVTVSAIVAVTPTQKDDAFLAKLLNIPVLGALLKAFKRFSVVDKKKAE